MQCMQWSELVHLSDTDVGIHIWWTKRVGNHCSEVDESSFFKKKKQRMLKLKELSVRWLCARCWPLCLRFLFICSALISVVSINCNHMMAISDLPALPTLTFPPCPRVHILSCSRIYLQPPHSPHHFSCPSLLPGELIMCNEGFLQNGTLMSGLRRGPVCPLPLRAPVCNKWVC